MTDDLKVSESPRYSRKVADVVTEMNKMKASLGTTIREQEEIRETQIENLKSELEDCKKMMEELENELMRRKESEKTILETLTEKTKQLEETKIELSRFQESEKISSLKFSEELNLTKKELKLATEAEITSKKAMDELAIALKEMKEKLVTTESELEAAKRDQNEQKEKFGGPDENLRTHLEESRKEAELQKNTAERLRFEAEESLLAWNGKEAVFVNCIKRGEEEKNSLIEENDKLVQALITAENLSKKSKEENNKLRDILKQAITEANMAKEASGIARAENSQLKDNLLEKEQTLEMLEGEIEILKSNLAAANEKTSDLKRLLDDANSLEESKNSDGLEESSTQVLKLVRAIEKDEERKVSSDEIQKKKNKKEQENGKKEVEIGKKEQENGKKEQENGKKEKEKEKKETNQEIQKRKNKKEQEDLKKEKEKEKKMGKTCSFSLKIPIKHKETEEDTKGSNQYHTETEKSDQESPVSDSDLFKGSIFDVAETPHAGTTQTHHQKTSSCDFFEDETLNYSDLETLEGHHIVDDGENDKNSRKKKAFIRRFGDLLARRKSLSKKESCPEHSPHQEKQLEKPSETQTQFQPQQDFIH